MTKAQSIAGGGGGLARAGGGGHGGHPALTEADVSSPLPSLSVKRFLWESL